MRGRTSWILLTLAASAMQAFAQSARVTDTVHNLSVTGPGNVKSQTETEVCKFCHIPHNAVVPKALWAQQLSKSRYETAEIRRGQKNSTPAPQPDGSSRLCLACHDGTVALGDIGNRFRSASPSGQTRLSRGQAGFIGTDLTGGHPISFVVPDGNTKYTDAAEVDIGLKPLAQIQSDRHVKLDSANKMQCTTCHDAHLDRYYKKGEVPRFWVKPSVQEVCLTCHDPL